MTEEIAGPKPISQNQSSPVIDWQYGIGFRAITLLLLTEVAGLALAQVPLSLSWDDFAFMDQGANLAVQTLLDRGFGPDCRFRLPLGLLPLLIGRLWFRLFGSTPSAYAAAMLGGRPFDRVGTGPLPSAIKVGAGRNRFDSYCDALGGARLLYQPEPTPLRQR